MKIFFIFSCFFITKYYNFVLRNFFLKQNFANINKISLKRLWQKMMKKVCMNY